MTERDWQEDMKGCEGLPPTPWQWVETDTREWIEDATQKLVFGGEISFWDWIGGDVNLEKLFRFFINAPEALPYWLREAATWKAKAYEAEVKSASAEAREKKLRELMQDAIQFIEDVTPTESAEERRIKCLFSSLYPEEETK